MSKYKAKHMQNRLDKVPEDPWADLARAVCLLAHADRRRAEKAIKEGRKYIPMKGSARSALATDVIKEVNEFFTPTQPVRTRKPTKSAGLSVKGNRKLNEKQT